MAVKYQGGQVVPARRRTVTQLDAMREIVMNINKAKDALRTAIFLADAEIDHLPSNHPDRASFMRARNTLMGAIANELPQAGKLIVGIPGYSGRQLE